VCADAGKPWCVPCRLYSQSTHHRSCRRCNDRSGGSWIGRRSWWFPRRGARYCALKAAETDATKRALATFGRPFGLELYRKDKNAVSASSPTVRSTTVESPPTQPRFGAHPDDTTPIPRPSHYYGRRHTSSMTDLLRQDQASLGPAASGLPQAKIDKSQLTIAEPKRLRNKAHLKFVASQPCLICGRQPSDPHHLRFAQPRAIGLKVSDEFTVPLCRGHHRQLHQAGDERAWWGSQRVNALEIARGLWETTHATTDQTSQV
jgi:Rad52/22 family double-strand break repair protein